MSPRIVIIGGVAAGMSAATRARRMNEHASITVLEKGGFISFANCGLPYYLAGRITSEEALLVTTPQKVVARYNIDARVHHEVTRVDRRNKSVEVTSLENNQTEVLPYDKLILATGASPIIPPIDHVRAPNVFLLRTMEDTFAVDAFLKARKPKRAVIIGAGFIGLEMAEAMHDRGLEVTLVEKVSHVLPPIDVELALPLETHLRSHGINLITGTGLKSFGASGDHVVSVKLEDEREVPTDLVLLSIGVRPNVKLATDAGIVLGPSGAIAVDQFQRTSDPDIYAVGDNSEVMHGVLNATTRIPLAGPANRLGRLAGEHAATGAAPGAARVLGTAIVQVFDLAVGMTGLSELAAKRAGIDADTAYVYPADHASYYPGSKPLRIKLVYERATGKLLGAQAIGGAGVDKRIDIIATAIHFGGTVEDLSQLDLAYAPQFASAKDPIHLAAMVAMNQRQNLMPAIAPDELNGQMLVDVRTAAEFANGSLPGAINIPLDELRERLDDLDSNMKIVTFCQVGLRGYIAQRILRQHGFEKVSNLKGGYSLLKGV